MELQNIAMNQLVSVIIPVYKSEQYLDACIKSVTAQTYNNIEIILVDDGSPDNCPALCDQYALTDSRIKVIHKTNGGLSDARNAGIEVANGKYLTFVDSDDIINPHLIEILQKPFDADPSLQISSCQMQKFLDGEQPAESSVSTDTKILDFFGFIQTPDYMVACGKIYAKEIFSDTKFPVGRLHEDEFVNYKMCYLANKIAYNPSMLYYYRQRKDSISNTVTEKRLTDLHDLKKEEVEYFKDKGLPHIYAFYLIGFAAAYTEMKKQQNPSPRFSSILTQWRKEINGYSKKELTFKQKVNLTLMLRFPGIRKIAVKVYGKG